MGKIDFPALPIKRSVFAKPDALRLVETLVRRIGDTIRKCNQLQAKPMNDEIDQRLGKKHSALAHLMEQIFVRIDKKLVEENPMMELSEPALDALPAISTR